MRMTGATYPTFIAGAPVAPALHKRTRIRARPVAAFLGTIPVEYINCFFEFFIFNFHGYYPFAAPCRAAQSQPPVMSVERRATKSTFSSFCVDLH
jgi:hypothetical protein